VISEVSLETCFKQFVEEARGLRLADVHRETRLYRRLVREFNEVKQGFIDKEEGEERRRIRSLLMAET
jgi:hypothetical protein